MGELQGTEEIDGPFGGRGGYSDGGNHHSF